MTDPRINPADSPGTPDEGTSPPSSGGSGQSGRHGLFNWGRHGSGGQRTAGGVGTATRSTPSTSVPQQSGQPAATAPPQDYRRAEHAEYGYADSMYGETSTSQDMLAKAAKQSWAVVAVGALGLIALGIMLLVWPHVSLTIVAILIGAALCVAGAVRMYEGFTAHGGESGAMRVGYVVIGLLAVLAGIYCLRHHALSLFLLAFVTGVYFILQGVAEIGVSVSAVSGRGLRFILGLFSIAAGLVLVIWPSISLVLLFTIMGAWLLFYGVMLGALAFSLRRSAKAMIRPGGPAMAAPAPTA